MAGVPRMHPASPYWGVYVPPVDEICRLATKGGRFDRRPLPLANLPQNRLGLVVPVADDGIRVLNEIEI